MATSTDDESSANGSISSAAAAASSGVGETLRSARERLGKPLLDVASQLRIRQPYLLALEEGRHKDLPGGTYAIGFLRTYAEFLGLDGEEMVRRFRQEAAGDLDSRSRLAFPSPVSEGRIPSGGILFLGLLLAAATYGGWYWMSARDARVAEIVPPMPERLASVLNRPAALTADKATPPKAEEIHHPDEMTRPTEPAADAAKPAIKEDVVPPSEEEEPAKAPEPPVKPAEPVKPQVAAKPPEAAKTSAPPKPADVAKPAAPQKPPEVAKAPEPVKPSELAVASAPAAEPAAAAPTATPAATGDSRVALRATTDDCWVQVREMDGRLLLSRLLRKGEVFQVPNRPGLSLTVGNAGALEIAVDGQKAPALGQAGQVRHDINLDPAKLLAGG